MRITNIIAAALLAASWNMSAMELVENGKPRATVVIDMNAKRSVLLAAQELVSHIDAISGVRLKIIRDDGQKILPDRLILVGNSPSLQKRNIDLSSLPDDGFIIHSTDDSLIIAGKDDDRYEPNYYFCPGNAGTLYGVYSVLEELGVRWFYPTELGTVIPKSSSVTVKNQDRRENPYFRYRNTGYKNFEWRRRLKAGGTVEIWSTRHTVSNEFRDRYKQTNPEWFFMDFYDRTRRGPQVDLHLPQVQDIMEKMAVERFESTKLQEGGKRFLILPIDGTWEPEVTSEWILSAVEKFSRRMLEKYPERKIVHCPYNQYYNSPERIRDLPPNMELLIAQHREWLLDPASREECYRMIARWQEFKPSAIYFCRYNAWSLRMNPALIPHTLSADLKRLAGMSEEGKAKIGGEMNFVDIDADSEFAWWEFLNEYVAAKLLWNPYADVDQILDDFCEKMFGPGAIEMRTFLDTCENAFADKEQRDMFHLATIEKLDALISAAKAKVGNTDYGKRLAMFDQGFDLLRAVRTKLLSGEKTSAADGRRGLIADFPLINGAGENVRSLTGPLQGKLQNAVWKKSASGGELVFSGDDSYVKFDQQLKMSDGDYTFEAWIKPNKMGGRQCIVGPDAWGRKYLAVEYVNPSRDGIFTAKLALQHRVFVTKGQSTFRLASNVVELERGKWVHIVGSFSTTNGMTLYLNGRIVGINPLIRTPSPLGVNYIGAAGKHDGGVEWCFNGAIADVKIYDRELSYSEVKQAFMKTSSKNRP